MRQLEHEEAAADRKTFPVTLLCPDWTDPRNVGSVFRLADAAGIAEVILAGTTPCPPNSKIRKTARSTEQTVPYRHVEDAAGWLREARAARATVVALEITDRSQSIFNYEPPPGPIVLIAGAERSGVDDELLGLCDHSVHLPMYGKNTSMNVAVALGAAVYLILMKLQ